MRFQNFWLSQVRFMSSGDYLREIIFKDTAEMH